MIKKAIIILSLLTFIGCNRSTSSIEQHKIYKNTTTDFFWSNEFITNRFYKKSTNMSYEMIKELDNYNVGDVVIVTVQRDFSYNKLIKIEKVEVKNESN